MPELEDWVERARGGDLSAYDELVRHFQDMAVGYAYSRLGDLGLAQDAAQEAFLLAYRQLDSLRAPGAFAGWLSRIVFTQCDRITRRSRPVSVPPEAASAIASSEPNSNELIERRELGAQVRAAVAALPESERYVTALFYMGDYSQAEVAGFLGISVSAVKSRLHSARERLRERMMDMVKDTLRGDAPSHDEQFTTRVRELIQAVKFMLTAQDMERAVTFYRDVMGLEVITHSPHWSELRYGDAIVALHGGGDGSFIETGLSFQVKEIATVCDAVVAGGGKLRMSPQDRPGEPILLADLTDPEGNGFMIAENKD